MPRPKRIKPIAEGSLFIRDVPKSTLDVLDEWAAELKSVRGSKVSRIDVAREVLHRAVQERLAAK